MESPPPTESELQTRIQQQEAVADIGQRALEVDELDELLHHVTETVAESLHAEYCYALQFLPDRDEFLVREDVGWQAERVGTTVSAEPDSHAGYVISGNAPVIVDDLPDDGRFDGSDLLTDHDVTSGISVPVGPPEEPWGILGAFTADRRSFTERDADFLRGVANVLASAAERERRERRLQQMERRYDAVFEDPNILVGLLEPDGTVLDINGTAMDYIDADLDAVTGELFWETPWWGEGDDVAADAREWTQRAAAGEYVEFETDLTRPEGEQYTLNGVFRPVTDDDGDVVSIIVSDRDVSERKRRERELEKAEHRYRTLVEYFPNGAVALVDEDLRYVTFGGTPEGNADVTRGDLEGAELRDALPQRLADVVVPHYRAALDGESSEFETTIDDSIYRFHFIPVRDDDGDVFAALGMSQDVTERRRTERELQRQTDQLETLFEVLPVGVVVADADGRIVEANDTAHEIWGGDVFDAGSVEEYDQYTVWWADSGERVGPEEMTLARVVDGEEVTDPDIFEIEAADGERRIVRVEGMPVRDAKGEVTRGVITLTDITERRKSKQALEESERRYRTLVENFPDGSVALFDEDLRYLAVGGTLFSNLDYDPEDRLGERFTELHPPEIIEAVKPHFEAAIDGEESTFEIEYADRHLHANTLPVRDASDEVFAGMLVVQDVTERREYERKLEESNERLEQFAYAASHDLQEPLRMVSSYLQLIENRYADELDDDGREFLEFAVDGADRMRDMIEGLLEYSRVDTRGDPFEPVDLEAVLADVRQDLQMKVEESDAAITVEDLPTVHGDASQLNQVFQNLLSNAMEYSGDAPPRIHVAADRTEAGDEWAISVSDEGIGIDPDDTDRVFDVFQSLHGPDDAGTGIGLALVKRIVERHDGDIWVDSAPGDGATFSFTLPSAAGRDT